MKKFYFIYFLLSTFYTEIKAQTTEKAPHKLLRIYEDNDFLNVRGKGTDEAYTNGTRIDFFYTKKHSHFFLERIFPKAGDSAINVYGWALTQLMFTPRDISKTENQPDDYPYSGALFASHSMYSYNPLKKYSLQSEILLGVRGPASLAKEAQKLIHRLIHYQQPMGWQNQLKNKVVANINFIAEKQLFAVGNAMEVMAGTQVAAGTLVNSVGIYPKIRFGKMAPYFNGNISQYSASSKQGHKTQVYFTVQPEIIFSASNGLLENSENNADNKARGFTNDKISPVVYLLNASVVVVKKRFGISFTQNFTSAMMEHLYSHQVGNISLYFALD